LDAAVFGVWRYGLPDRRRDHPLQALVGGAENGFVGGVVGVFRPSVARLAFEVLRAAWRTKAHRPPPFDQREEVLAVSADTYRLAFETVKRVVIDHSASFHAGDNSAEGDRVVSERDLTSALETTDTVIHGSLLVRCFVKKFKRPIADALI